MELDKLIRSQAVYLTRRSDKTHDDTFDDLGQLRNDILRPKEIPNLSLNILGAMFREENTFVKTKNKGNDNWEPGTIIRMHDFLNDFEIRNEGCIIYMNANGLHDKLVPFTPPTKAGNGEMRKRIEKFHKSFNPPTKPIIKGDKFIETGTTFIKHSPTNLNYWHVEYQMLDFEKEPIAPSGSKYIEEFCLNVLKNIIKHNSFHSLDSAYTPIPLSFYLHQPSASFVA